MVVVKPARTDRLVARVYERRARKKDLGKKGRDEYMMAGFVSFVGRRILP